MNPTDTMISEISQTARVHFYDSNYIKVRNSEIIYGERSLNSGNLGVGNSDWKSL